MAAEAKVASSGEGAAMAAVGWVPDERDSFISWLRGEFAAANAMIDALCGHLQVCWPGEYDLVLACIQQRRFNWSPILHMQHYFSVAEVLMALQQVSLKKHQQQMPIIPPGSGPGPGSSSPAPAPAPVPAMASLENEINEKPQHVIEVISDSFLTSKASPENTKPENKALEDPFLETKVSSLAIGEEPSNSFPAANASRKHLVGIEEVEGEQVNVLEGLELHENVFHSSIAAGMIELLTDSKKKAPKVSNAIQFGTIPSDMLADESENKPKDGVVEEEIPPYLQSVIEGLVNLEVVGDKRPDSCSITLLKPGESMRLKSYLDFEQPVYMVPLGSDSSLTLGRNTKNRGPADGLFCLTLTLGSVLVLQGNSLEMVQLGVSPSHSHRAIVTLGKRSSSPATKNTTTTTATTRLKTSPDSRHRDSASPLHDSKQSITPPPLPPAGVISPQARSPPVHLSSRAAGAGVVPAALGTGVFLPNGSAPVHSTHHQQHQMQMNGLHHQRRPAPVPTPPPHFAPPQY